MSENSKHITANQLRWFVWSLYIWMVAIIILAWVFYPERYDFWLETTSILGGIYTNTNPATSNLTSMIIFSSGFVILGILCIIISVIYFRNMKNFQFALPKGILLVIVGIGAIFIAIPHDYARIPIVHGLGAFLFLAGLATLNFAFQLLHCIAKYYPQTGNRDIDYYVDYTFVVLFLLVDILYFVIEGLLFFGSPITLIDNGLMQKILLFTALIAGGLLDLDDMKSPKIAI